MTTLRRVDVDVLEEAASVIEFFCRRFVVTEYKKRELRELAQRLR